MATIKAFAAYRPCKGLEEEIAALPYDVYSREEAKAYVDEHPQSFLAIDRAESQFSADVDTYDERVYQKAKELLDDKIADGSFLQDEKPCYYIYRQTWKGRSQTGIVACASIDDYLNGVIKKHENTVEAKEQDRIRHVDTTNAQTGPIFLAYRNHSAIDEVTERVMEGKPCYDFASVGEVQNTVWIIEEDADIEAIEKAFSSIDSIYIADGHHRCASAVKVGLKRREANPGYTGNEEYNYFLSVLFPENQLEILDYNRVVTDMGGLEKEDIMMQLKLHFNVKPYRKNIAKPDAKGEIGFYMGGNWYMLSAKSSVKSGDPVDGLDVAILQKYVLGPIFDIRDPRTDPKIQFVGGIRGMEELVKHADESKGCAFAMYPTQIAELFAVADAGKLMPPKSTWFEPKLLSGLFIHMLG